MYLCACSMPWCPSSSQRCRKATLDSKTCRCWKRTGWPKNLKRRRDPTCNNGFDDCRRTYEDSRVCILRVEATIGYLASTKLTYIIHQQFGQNMSSWNWYYTWSPSTAAQREKLLTGRPASAKREAWKPVAEAQAVWTCQQWTKIFAAFRGF